MPFAPQQVHSILADLVAYQSVSDRSVLPVADYVCERLSVLGARVERLPADGPEKINVLAFMGPQRRGGLMLSGHLDVVPADAAGWESDPFKLREESDRLVARGTADMKGFIAMCLSLAQAIDPARLRQPLAFLFTCDEETGSIGAQHFVRQAARREDLPKAMIIGEPTELKVVRMHKGHMRLRVRVPGVAAHSGYPNLGDNAVEKAAEVIAALADLRGQLENDRAESSRYFAEYPHPILTVATVAGGTAFNVVPETCEIGVGLRLLPGQSSAEYVARIIDRVNRIVSGGDDLAVEVLNDSPPLMTPEDCPLHRRLCAMTGQTESVAVHYASDAGPLATLGMECVLWGPGSIKVAHKPNEYILRRDLAEGLEKLTAFVHSFCGEDPAE